MGEQVDGGFLDVEIGVTRRLDLKTIEEMLQLGFCNVAEGLVGILVI